MSDVVWNVSTPSIFARTAPYIKDSDLYKTTFRASVPECASPIMTFKRSEPMENSCRREYWGGSTETSRLLPANSSLDSVLQGDGAVTYATTLRTAQDKTLPAAMW